MPKSFQTSQSPVHRAGRLGYTVDGESFDISSDRWTLEADGRVAHIKWDDVRSSFEPDLIEIAKNVAASLLLISKARTVENQVDALRRLAKFLAKRGDRTGEILGHHLVRHQMKWSD